MTSPPLYKPIVVQLVPDASASVGYGLPHWAGG